MIVQRLKINYNHIIIFRIHCTSTNHLAMSGSDIWGNELRRWIHCCKSENTKVAITIQNIYQVFPNISFIVLQCPPSINLNWMEEQVWRAKWIFFCFYTSFLPAKAKDQRWYLHSIKYIFIISSLSWAPENTNQLMNHFLSRGILLCINWLQHLWHTVPNY